MKFGLSPSSVPARLAVCLGICLILSAFSASAQDPIVLILGSVSANAGDTVEISVDLEVGDTAPSTLVVVLVYDPTKLAPFLDYYEFIQRDPLGNPILDNNGDPVTRTSAVRPGPAATAAGKGFDPEVHPEGALAVTLFGSFSSIGDGLVLSAAFKVIGGVDNEVIPVTGATEADPIEVFVEDSSLPGGGVFQSLATSAATQEGGGLGVVFVTGQVTLGCTEALPVTGVAASNGRSDGVFVTWNDVAPAGESYTYRVWRGESADLAEASPLGEGWQSASAFLDESSRAPIEVQAPGCLRPGQFDRVIYYYWVKARTQTLCAGPFSDLPATGSRGAASKSGAAKTGIGITALPAERWDSSSLQAAPDATLALRLQAGEPLDASSLCGQLVDLATQSPVPCAFSLAPLGDSDYWFLCRPLGSWPEGADLVLTGGGETLTGKRMGPVTRQFRVVEPISGKLGEGSGNPPELRAAVGSPIEVSPREFLPMPRKVLLPVPREADSQDLTVHYLVTADGERAWYPAEQVSGLLAELPVLEQQGGRRYVVCEVRYGGLLCLAATSHKPQAASLAVTRQGYSPWGDFLLYAILAAGLCLHGQSVRRWRSRSA